jgi:Xaa-Pro dipeptidase
VHELPDLVAGNQRELAVGTTFTVEPGMYLPGRLGVHIEDDMVITVDGAYSLTVYPCELQLLPIG